MGLTTLAYETELYWILDTTQNYLRTPEWAKFGGSSQLVPPVPDVSVAFYVALSQISFGVVG
jgi:hypothetical protein